MFVYSRNRHLCVLMTPQSFSKIICERIGVVQSYNILQLRTINDALKALTKVEASNNVYASNVRFEEMEPTHEVKPKACTKRSVERKEYKFGNYLRCFM